MRPFSNCKRKSEQRRLNNEPGFKQEMIWVDNGEVVDTQLIYFIAVLRLCEFSVGCDGGVRKTYVGPTGHCWGSGSWGRAPGVYPDDSAPYGCSSPDGTSKD